MASIASKVSYSLNIAGHVLQKTAEVSVTAISVALNVVQKTTKVSTTAINLLRYYRDSSSKILVIDSRVDQIYPTATKVNHLCGLIELPKILFSLARAIVDEVVMHRSDGIEDEGVGYNLREQENRKKFRITYRSVSAPYQHSVLTSSLYILVRVAECIRPLNNAIAFCKGNVHIPDKLESLANKLMGPSLIFTSFYLAARIQDNEISPDYEYIRPPKHWRQFTLDLLSSITRIVIGIFLTINSFSKNKRYHPLNKTIMTYFALEALCFIHRKYYLTTVDINGYSRVPRSRRESAELLSNPF